MKHIVGFSGGIDSQACARWVLDRFPTADVILLNSDAGGNEHPLTTEFIAEYSAKVHPVITIQAIVLDANRPGATAEAEKRGIPPTDPMNFALLAQLKGRFPSRRAQFCTESLKLVPQRRWIAEHMADEEFERYTGVRRDESHARREAPERVWDKYFDCWQNNPLVDWPKLRCFDSVAGEPINPLYSLGFERVGCAPCVNSGKEDIRRWADRFPAMIDKLRDWELQVGRAFFPPMIPRHPINWVDEVVSWARTDRGGVQFNILKAAGVERPACESSFGLCE